MDEIPALFKEWHLDEHGVKERMQEHLQTGVWQCHCAEVPSSYYDLTFLR